VTIPLQANTRIIRAIMRLAETGAAAVME